MKVRLHVFETIQSLLLFAVSTLFTCERFAELAGNTLASKLPFIMLGLGFEITRVSLWIRYCLENDRTFKIVALFLTVLSMTASLSKITASLETIDSKSVSVVESINITNEVIKSYDEQIAVLTERLKATPQEYVNTAKRLQEQIDKLLSAKMEALGKKQEQVVVQRDVQETVKTRDMFDTIGAVFGLTDSLVKLLRMLFLGLITLGSEIGLLVSSKAAVTCRDEQVCEDSEKLETDTRNDTQGSVESVSLEDVLCKSARKGAYPVPSWDSVTKGGVLIERDKYMEIVEILRRRGLVYKRGKRYWFGAGITQEDIRDILHEIVY